MKVLDEIKAIETELINRLCWIPDPETILPHTVFVEDENENGVPEYYHCTLEAINPDDQTCTLLNHSTNTRSSDYSLAAINIEWLATLWNWYKEKHAEDETNTELLYSAASGNYCEPTQDNRPIEETFHAGDIVCLTESAIAIIDEDFGTEAADYRKNRVLEIQRIRQEPNTHLWHITVRDIFEDDEQEFLSCYLRPIIQKESRSRLAYTSPQPSDKELFVYVFPTSRLERNATDIQIIADYDSTHDEDELTLKLTPDEFAAYCNDGFFNDSQQYVRFIITDK